MGLSGMGLSGGTGVLKTTRLERLFRNARCDCFHPVNSALVREIVGKTLLGIDFGERPRWGKGPTPSCSWD